MAGAAAGHDLRAIPFEILRGGGGMETKNKNVWGVFREKNIMSGGGLENLPFRPPEDLKWNSPNAKLLHRTNAHSLNVS